MIEIIQGPPVAQFVGAKCGAQFAEPYQAIGFGEGGAVLGGCVFNNFNGRNVDLSVANDIVKWPPAFVRFFEDHIWNTMGVARVTMVVRPGTERMCLKMGAKMEGLLRDWYGEGQDGVLFGMLKAEWKLKR